MTNFDNFAKFTCDIMKRAKVMYLTLHNGDRIITTLNYIETDYNGQYIEDYTIHCNETLIIQGDNVLHFDKGTIPLSIIDIFQYSF